MSVLAPFTASYSERSPYVTLEEFRFSPTASVIDTTNLVEGGGPAAQDRALSDLIVRASNMADTFATGKGYGTIGASLNTESDWFYPNRKGAFEIHPDFGPILELASFSCGWPGAMTTVLLSGSNTVVSPTLFTVMYGYGLNAQFQLSNLGQLGSANPNVQWWCQYTYVNGYANAFLTQDAPAGTNSLTLTNVTGFYPSAAQPYQVTIWDGLLTETVTISSSYTKGNNPVTLSANLQYRHGTGCNVSAVPPVIKQAVIHFTVAMIKDRGQGGFEISSSGVTDSVGSPKGMSFSDDYALGYDLLEEFKQVWGRA